jgi:hypothetical protein
VHAETLGGQDVVLMATASFLALCGEMLADGAESGCIRGLVRRDGG